VIAMKNRKLIVVFAVAALVVSVGACKKKEAGPASGPGGRARMQFPVEVAPVAAQNLVYAVTAVGSVEAFEKVQVTARVASWPRRARPSSRSRPSGTAWPSNRPRPPTRNPKPPRPTPRPA
jgi:multidrug efflux pump subunit AcrA (membrane-fusion protein)